MEYSPGQHILPEHLPEAQRPILRAVALAYRRAKRAGLDEQASFEAALAEYRRVDKAAPADRVAASHQVGIMIAAAVNANIRWFWQGPDV